MLRKLVITLAAAFPASFSSGTDTSPLSPETTYEISSPVPLLLKWVPGGEFRMGDLSGSGQADERPVRAVTLTGFWMMNTEVTVEVFQRFVSATDHDIPPGCDYFSGGWQTGEELSWRSPGFAQGPDHPVTCVSWQDAMAFAGWLQAETGLAFTLPNEAQWEYAARAGSMTRFIHGDEAAELCSHANGADQRALADYPDFDVNSCDDGYTRTAPVASFMANAWGLHDMTGNVWEWVADCWPAEYDSAPRDGESYQGGDCQRRGYRGGAYGDVPFFLRVSLRNRGYPGERRDDVGFRLVLNKSH